MRNLYISRDFFTEGVMLLEKVELLKTDSVPFRYGKPPRRVKCYDAQTGELVREFHSVSEAGRAVGKPWGRQVITNACCGQQKTAYGYRWEYVEETS